MERTFRLEFNEKQQHFHLDNFTHKANTHGWVTIMDSCTDFEFHVFEAYVNRKKKMVLTQKYLVECLKELQGFRTNLMEYKLAITKINP